MELPLYLEILKFYLLEFIFSLIVPKYLPADWLCQVKTHDQIEKFYQILSSHQGQ